MSYPVGNGTKQDFDANWKIDGGFGDWRSSGSYFHEGLDINYKAGGDSDLGMPLRAVADGKIVYYHDNSHPTLNFGRHLVYEVVTSRGKRWLHYAHCQEITASVKDIKEGDVIAKIGKSGTTLAHLHVAIFKVDPKGLRNGIDTIAKTKDELNAWWEDPFLVFNDQPITEDPCLNYKKELDEKREQISNYDKQVAGLLGEKKQLTLQIDELNSQLGGVRGELATTLSKVDSQNKVIQSYVSEDAVQIETLKTFQRERDSLKDDIFWALDEISYFTKVPRGSDIAKTEFTKQIEALEKLNQMYVSYNDKIKALEIENKKLLVKSKKIDNLTKKDLVQLLLEKIKKELKWQK